MNQKSHERTSNTKLFGLPRPLAGALIGILSFLLVRLLFWSVGLNPFAVGLLYPGLWSLSTIESLIRVLPSSMSVVSDPLETLVIYGVSSTPLAISGSLIISKNVILRIYGVILLVIHGLLWIFFSLLFGLVSD